MIKKQNNNNKKHICFRSLICSLTKGPSLNWIDEKQKKTKNSSSSNNNKKKNHSFFVAVSSDRYIALFYYDKCTCKLMYIPEFSRTFRMKCNVLKKMSNALLHW